MNNVIHLTRKRFAQIQLAGIYHPKYWLIPFTMLLTGLAIWLSDADQWLFLQINSTDFLSDAFWLTVTQFGDPVVALTLLLPFCWKRPELGGAIIIAALIATFFVHSLKFLLDVPRPAGILSLEQIRVIGPTLTQNAFPSGHTATIFVLAGVVCCLLQTYWRYALLLVGFALMVGISRITVGAHWPVDVITGALIGWTSAVAGVYIARKKAWTLQRSFAVICFGCALTLLFAYDVNGFLKLLAFACLVSAAPGVWRLFR